MARRMYRQDQQEYRNQLEREGRINMNQPAQQTQSSGPQTYGTAAGTTSGGRAPDTSSYDPLIQYQEQQRRLRAEEGREMDRMLRMLEGEPDRLRGEQQTATQEMRRQAALRMAQQGGRGNVIGAMSMAKGVGQEAANIGTQFGSQIRDAARQAAQARIERKQQEIESMAKAGVDTERVAAELRTILERNSADTKNKVGRMFGLDVGQAASPEALVAEVNALERTTRDPLALQMIRQFKSNIEQGMDPFAGMAQA